MIPLPLDAGDGWKLYTYDYATQDGAFSGYLYALDMGHAEQLLAELKATAVLAGQMIEVIDANPQPAPDVAELVEALEAIIKAAPSSGPLWYGSKQIDDARAALIDYHSKGEETKHPIHPIKENRIVSDLLDFASNHGFGLNEIAFRDYSLEDRQQLARLIGYNLGGEEDKDG